METERYSPPKYFQISREIVSQIHSGALPAGKLVPSENEIIEKYKVSNTTARKALHELEKEGWVSRVKGKGTFVRDYTVVRAINRIFGFLILALLEVIYVLRFWVSGRQHLLVPGWSSLMFMILLVGGSKSGVASDRFYRRLIATADKRLDMHLADLRGSKRR